MSFQIGLIQILAILIERAAYQSNRTETHNLAPESSPLCEPVAELARKGFAGTVTELHARLNCVMSEGERRSVRWPKAPSALGRALRRVAANLRAVGIEPGLMEWSDGDDNGNHRRMVNVTPKSWRTNPSQHEKMEHFGIFLIRVSAGLLSEDLAALPPS